MVALELEMEGGFYRLKKKKKWAKAQPLTIPVVCDVFGSEIMKIWLVQVCISISLLSFSA